MRINKFKPDAFEIDLLKTKKGSQTENKSLFFLQNAKTWPCT